MKKLFAGFAVVAVLGILSYWAASHHLVRTDQGTIVLAKRFLACADTFVDVREWSSADFDAHPELKRALIDQGYRELLTAARIRDMQASLDGLKEKASAVAENLAAQVSETAESVAKKVSATVAPLRDDPAGSDEETAAKP